MHESSSFWGAVGGPAHPWVHAPCRPKVQDSRGPRGGTFGASCPTAGGPPAQAPDSPHISRRHSLRRAASIERLNPSVPDAKSVAKVGGGSAALARRDDEGIVGAIPRRSNVASVVETPPNLVTDFGFGTLASGQLLPGVAVELAVERLAVEAEHLRRPRPVPADRLHHAQDVAPLDLLERD